MTNMKILSKNWTFVKLASTIVTLVSSQYLKALLMKSNTKNFHLFYNVEIPPIFERSIF